MENRYRFIKRPFLSVPKIIQYFKTVYYNFIIVLAAKKTLKMYYFKFSKTFNIYEFMVKFDSFIIKVKLLKKGNTICYKNI